MVSKIEAELRRRAKQKSERRKIDELLGGVSPTGTGDIQRDLYKSIASRERILSSAARELIDSGIYSEYMGRGDIKGLMGALEAGIRDKKLISDLDSDEARFYAKDIRRANIRGVAKARQITRLADTVEDLFTKVNYPTLDISMSRMFNSIKGLEDGAIGIMRTTLTDGITDGVHPHQLARLLRARTSVNKVRAIRIARTEATFAQNSSYIAEFNNAEREGKQYRMIWITEIDGRERASHRARDGRVYTKKQANSLLGEPNCRCAISAVSPRNKKYNEVKSKIPDSELV